MDVIKKIEELKLIPIVVIEETKNALPLGNALLNAGLPVIEITFRTAAAAAITSLKKQWPDMLIGAGTVLKTKLYCL